MKRWERVILYSVAAVAVIYGLWAHSKPSTLNRIDRKNLVPANEELLGRGSGLRELCRVFGWLEMGAALKGTSLSEGTRPLIISHLDYNVKLLNLWDMAPPLEEARDALIDAIRAEIAVLNFEKQHTKTKRYESLLDNQDFMLLIEISMSLRGEAATQIDKLMYKI